jgi:hypothetical protein
VNRWSEALHAHRALADALAAPIPGGEVKVMICTEVPAEGDAAGDSDQRG